MSFWPDEFLTEVKDINLDTVMGPLEEASDKETVIAQVGESSRRLYGLALKYDRKSLSFLLEAKFSSDKEMQKRWVGMAAEAFTRHTILIEMFWESLRDEHCLWSPEHELLGVRKGWKVVIRESDDVNPGNEFLNFISFWRKLMS